MYDIVDIHTSDSKSECDPNYRGVKHNRQLMKITFSCWSIAFELARAVRY